MEDKSLPTVRDVITKLKSDGIFDNFRKSCVNSIENEVCEIGDQSRVARPFKYLCMNSYYIYINVMTG